MPELTPESLRAQRALRPLEGTEDGTDVFNLPDGVFGFTYAPAFKEMPLFSKKPYHSFEVHKTKEGEIHIVGYVSPEVKSKIDAKAGTIEAAIYPDSYQGATAMVSIDIADMQPAKKAITREDGNPMKTLVYAQ